MTGNIEGIEGEVVALLVKEDLMVNYSDLYLLSLEQLLQLYKKKRLWYLAFLKCLVTS